MRTKYRFDKATQKMVEVDLGHKPKQELHYVQGDEIEAVESMATDQREIFTSRSALKRHYKEHGYEMTGGDHITGKPIPAPKASREEIRISLLQAKQKLEWGMAPMNEKEKEICNQEERAYREYKKRQW